MAETAAPGKVEIPNKPKWECQITSPPKDPKGFTVGEVFNLECQGQTLSLQEPLHLKFDEKSQYTMVLLKPHQITDNKISYQATAYRPGQHKVEFLDIVDGQGNGFISNPMQWQVSSLMDPQKPQEEPFGPIGPMTMPWPPWFFFSLALGFVLFMVWVLIFLKRRVQRKNLESNIKKYQSPMGSYHQFSKDLRLLKRGVVFSPRVTWTEPQVEAYLQRLNEVFRMYILREYIVPAQDWSVKNILKHMRRKDRQAYPRYAPSVLKAFRELERSKGQLGNISGMDCEQITNICWHAVDDMWKNKNRKAAAP